MTPKIGQWIADDSYYDFAILADSTAWNKVNKLWVPD
jgi:hypothetical protein